MHYVYVLRSIRDGKLYIGSTGDLSRRTLEHQEGKSDATACRRPFELLFYEAFQNKALAERRERYFKTTKGKATLKMMLNESSYQGKTTSWLLTDVPKPSYNEFYAHILPISCK